MKIVPRYQPVKKNQLEQRLGKMNTSFFVFESSREFLPGCRAECRGFERTGISSSSSSSSFLRGKKYELEVKLEFKYIGVERVEL